MTSKIHRAARDETASSSVEHALILGLAAASALAVKSAVAGPLFQKLVDASRALSKALG